MASRKITTGGSTLFFAAAFAALSTTCFAAIAWEKAREHPEFPGLCMWGGKIGSFNAQDAVIYQEGESWDTGDCIRATCAKLSDGLYIQYASCGVVGTEPPCIIVPGNRSLPYPECCPRPWCPELPPQLTEDPLLTTNEIEKDNEITERFYQSPLRF
ncbi:uncharacterized protein [Hetaerina americana]|uniref:uncharacterized protein n=1 Tax=Hetaerina americana TaxID=62018 RepID=UPI003A7F3071